VGKRFAHGGQPAIRGEAWRDASADAGLRASGWTRARQPAPLGHVNRPTRAREPANTLTWTGEHAGWGNG
jgi:hypothetical protein